jgi:hypothetical protein
MIKFSMFFSKLIVAAVIATLFTSCNGTINLGSIDGNGNVTTETRNVNGDFPSIEASSGLNVVLEQSETKSITVEADQNLQEHIITRVEKGVLIIETDENIDESKSKKVTVKLPKIEGISSSSGSSITSVNTLKSDAIKIKSSSGSEIEVALEADSIVCESSSGSSIAINGKALSLETASSSGSEIDAGKLFANDVIAQTSSGSSTNVHPIVSLKAKASSGSSIDYNHVPKTITKDENSGGSISQE